MPKGRAFGEVCCKEPYSPGLAYFSLYAVVIKTPGYFVKHSVCNRF